MGLFGKKSKTNKHNYKLGLALSGGGTRGIAHIGVFKAFEEAGLKFSCVAGTSAGSILGAMYCKQLSWQEMLSAAKQLTKKEILDKRFVIGSDSQNVANVVTKILGETTFEQLKIPFAAVAVDISRGEEVVLVLTFQYDGNEMQDFFSEKETVYFHTPDELAEKIAFFNSHDDARRAVAAAGRAKYHALFNAQRTLRYMVEATLGEEFSEDYEWAPEVYR